MGPGESTVVLEHLAGAVLGDACTCPPAPAPDTIVTASAPVFYKGKAAARVDDETAHGGVLVAGAATVFIGK